MGFENSRIQTLPDTYKRPVTSSSPAIATDDGAARTGSLADLTAAIAAASAAGQWSIVAVLATQLEALHRPDNVVPINAARKR